ncbi:hypothetical protein [Nocardia sp. XZ_19_369]|uniref:hypothetical protein n=1 Tax=Nocardia sp. XZ_19_369 TaxID=2769487 RepID=UPI00188E4C31|nr:hypothetical protein [Nocardia sp. XZ_19_369]
MSDYDDAAGSAEVTAKANKITRSKIASISYGRCCPETLEENPAWIYDQRRKRGDDRHYSGRILYIHGSEGERFRGELAEVVRDLLEWAIRQQDNEHFIEDSEAA